MKRFLLLLIVFILGIGYAQATEPEHVAPPALTYTGFLPLEQTLLGQLPEELLRRLQEFRMYDAWKFWMIKMQAAANTDPSFSLPVTEIPLAHITGTHVTLSPDGKFIAIMGENNNVIIIDTNKLTAIRTFPYQDNDLAKIAFSNDSKLIAIAIRTTVNIWNLTTGFLKYSFVIKAPIGTPLDYLLKFSPDNTLIIFATLSDAVNSLDIWDTVTGKVKFSILIEESRTPITNIAISPNNKFIALGSFFKDIITILDIETNRFINKFHNHTDGISALTFSPNGRFLVSGSADNTICIQDLRTNNRQVLKAHTKPIRHLLFSPDGHMLISSSKSETIIWNTIDGTLVYNLKRSASHSDPIDGIALALPNLITFTKRNGPGTSYIHIWQLYSDNIANYFASLTFEAKLILNDLYQAYVNNNHYDLTNQPDIWNYLNTLDKDLKKAINKLQLIIPALTTTETEVAPE